MASRNLIVAITSDARGFSKGFNDAQRQVDKFGRSVGQSGGTLSGFTGRVSAMSASLAGLAATVGTAFVATKVVDFAQDSVRAFSDLEESINAINVTFDDGADKILEFGKSAATSVGLAQSQVNQALIPIGALFRNFGFSADEAADAAIDLTKRAADLASVFNTDVEDALGAIGSALRGEQEPLRRFGADISAARVEAFLLSEGIVKSKSEIDEAAKVFGRYQLVLQDTARAQGDFANTADSYANRQRIVAAQLEETRVKLGEALLPIFETFVDLGPVAAEAIEGLVPVVDSVARSFEAWGPAAVDAVAQIATAVSTLPATFGEGRALGESFALQFTSGILEILNLNLGTRALFNILGVDVEALDNQLEVARGAAEQTRAEFNALGEATKQVGEFGVVNAASNALLSLRDEGRLTESAWRRIIDGFALSNPEIEQVAANLDSVGVSLNRSFISDELERINRELANTAESARLTGLAEFVGVVEDAIDPLEEFYGILESPPEIDDLDEALEGLNDAVKRTVKIFDEAPEQVETSIEELFQNVREKTAQNQRFAAALATLAAAGADALVAELYAQGPAVLGAAEDLAANIPQALELDAEIRQAIGATLAVANAALADYRPETGPLAAAFAQTGTNMARAFELGFTQQLLSGNIRDAIAATARQGSAPSGIRTSPSLPPGVEVRAAGGPVSAGESYVVGEEGPETYVSGSPEIVGADGPELFTPKMSGFIYPERLEFRAAGGPVTSGEPYIVGEQGPEWFVPKTNGTIYPNGSVPAGQTVNITVISPEPAIDHNIQRGVLLSGLARTAEVARI